MLAPFVALTLAQRDAGSVYMPPKACLTDVLSNFVRLDADADGFYGGDRGDGRWSEDEEEEQLMEQHYAEEQAHDALRGQLGTAYDGGLLG